MSTQIFLTILVFSLPMYSALVCGTIIFPYPGSSPDRTSKNLRKLLVIYFLTVAFGWFNMLIYPFFPKLFVYIQSFSYLSFLLVQILFYHFVFNITRLNSGERFSPYHYLLPGLIFGTLFIWSFFVPFNAQLVIVESNAGEIPEGYEAYYWMFTSKVVGRFVFSLTYTTLALRRLLRYRHAVLNFSANEERSSLGWLRWLTLLAFGFLLMPFLALLVGRTSLYTVLPAVFTAMIVAVQHIAITYNMMKERFLSFEEGLSNTICERYAHEADSGTDADGYGERLGNLTASGFEKYIRTNKPYLDSNLKITDLAQQLGTNRSYLSSFINDTYGTNFSRYINTFRLGELHLSQQDPDFSRLPLIKQIEKVGFGSYRNYKRFRESLEIPSKNNETE